MSLSDRCLFCRVVEGAIPSTRVYETGEVLGFRDIHPQAPVHVLFIPKKHIEGVHHITEANKDSITSLIFAANQVAKELSVDQGGYRLVINCRKDGGQTVDHLHVHLLGGRAMHWPPG